MHLRAMLCELEMPSISSFLPIPSIQTAFDDDGTPRDRAPIERRFGRFASELECTPRRSVRRGNEACPTDDGSRSRCYSLA